jgi:hypothetical protein
MDYIFVKDSEGFVSKKIKAQVAADEQIISAAEYKELSGDNYYEQHFTHGGRRMGAGRKKKLSDPLEYQIRVSKQEKDFIAFAREHHFDYAKIMQ